MRQPLPVKKPAFKHPPKVRYEPPTIEEAIAAASDLSSDVENQIEIAAGLMGVPPEEIRPHIRKASPVRPVTTIVSGRRTVVVERTVRRRAAG